MSNQTFYSPVYSLHEEREAFFLPYGTDESNSAVVETFGDLDMEYAALRKGCVIFDEAHMGTLRITGSERLPFLNNMLTAKLDDLQPNQTRKSFWLNRKGRIDADLRISESTDAMYVRVDRHLAQQTADALNGFIFAEDIEITNASNNWHRFAIHGPQAAKLLSAALNTNETLNELEDGQCTLATYQDQPILIERDDICAEIGLGIAIPTDTAASLYTHLLTTAEQHPQLKARPTGWMALNAARIEAGTPLFNLDFGDSNLPAESGIIDQRVHFAKGCYLGQEVVARMHARGVCARQVVALRVQDQRITPDHTEILQPTTESQIFEPGKENETPVGVVTSSTISPMLGAIPICFAMIKAGHNSPGTQLSVGAEGGIVRATIQDELQQWKKLQG